MENKRNNSGPVKFGYYISILTAVLTVVTFAIAVCTPPLSGPFCQGDCFQYPYDDIISRFPRDYYWMFTAIILTFSYMVMIVAVHHNTSEDKRLYSLVGVAFAIISTLILSLDYFVQVSFIQPSLVAGETEGIAMLSQFNPHGIFIIMEEMGFITMNISLLCLAPLFTGRSRVERSLKWTVLISFVLMLLSLVAVILAFGINREYRFEVIIISITWIELIIVSILLSRHFR